MAGSPKSKRKRKRQSASIFSVPTQGISISNTFAGLSDLNDMDVGTGSLSQNVNTNSDAKNIKPPPIVVAISDFKAFRMELSSLKFHIKLANMVNVAFWPKK